MVYEVSMSPTVLKFAPYYICLSALTLIVASSSTEAEGVPATATLKERDATFSNCGGTLKEPRGAISTPGFPDPYPIPIRCRWVIEAPADKVVALYFTQYYMREGLVVSEYAFFSETLYLGKKEFGAISSDREPTYLVSNKPVLVLDFSVREGGNVHLRVREYLLDVFGFNVTYEVIGRNETVRKDPCVYNHCSFTGSCLASAFFDGFYCRCFADFFGSECQYSPGCEPSDSGGLCKNGGTCRYYIGSTVKSCECPPGFEGTRCEKKKNDHLIAQCVALGCTQTCTMITLSNYKCSCFNGYHLTDDRKTCVEKGRTRYLVSFKLYDQNVDLAHLDVSRYNLLKKGIENALLQLFQPRLYKAENLTVLSFQPGAVVQFHFFGEKEDSHQAKTVFEESLKRGRIGRYAVDKNYIRFEWEPALSIQGIEPSEKMPVVQGAELSLACIVQGSSAMIVQWFKDGAHLNVETTYRGMWTTLVPKNSKDQYTALLGFDKAHVLDSGEFTCQVSDWGTVQNKSIVVSVITVPRPLVIPLTATVIQGTPFVVTCLSEDDQYGSFGYNWLKNGRILNPSIEPELVEDLFPAGSRLLVKDTRGSATYTCIITSTAGATRRDSIVTVLMANGNVPVCPSEKYMEVKWGQAAANTEDIQACPKGYTGEVRRHCNMRKSTGAAWTDPDYSRCLSSEFLAIKEKFQSLRMGYLITDVGTLLQNLRLYLWNMKEQFHIAEGEPVVDLLEGLHEYERTRGSPDKETMKNNSQVFMDIVSFLLDSPQLIQKQSHVIKLHQEILSYGLMQGTTASGETFHLFERPALVLEVGQVLNEGQHVLKFPSQRSVRETKGTRNEQHASWLTDSVELDFNTWIVENFQEMNDSISIAVVFYKNFSAFLPERFLARHGSSSYYLHSGLDLEYQLHSRLVAVAMQTGHRKISGAPPATRSGNQKLKVKARLAHLNHTVNRHIMWNISCGMADFSQGNVQFSMEGCQPVQTGNFSLCQCNHVGTYAVLLTTYAQSEQLFFNDTFEVIAGIGCAVCAFFVCLTFLILVVLWRKISGSITALKIQVCVALMGAYGTILKALHESLKKDSYPYVVSSILFFLLAAFCMQLCLGLTVYIECVDLKNIRYPELKLATLGWAVPMIVVGATLAAQVPEGFKLNSWWLELHTNYFYAYAASIVIMAVLHFMLVMTVKTELKCHQKMDDDKYSKTSNRTRLLHRSLLIAVSLLLVSVSSIMYVNYDDEMYKYAFSGSSGFLGFIIFLCYTVCSENAHSMCSSSQSIEDDIIKQEPRLKGRKGSFQGGFLKPEIVSDSYCVSKIPETIEVDVSLEQHIRKLGYQMPPGDPKEWKEIEQLLLEKQKAEAPPSCIVRDFTVHHQQQQQQLQQQQQQLQQQQLQQHTLPMVSRPKDIEGMHRSDSEDGFRPDFGGADLNSPHSYRKQWRQRREQGEQEDPLSPPFQLQLLEGSPKSSNHLHVLGNDENHQTEEDRYELNHKGSAPDILEPTNHQSFTGEHYSLSPRPGSAAAEEHAQIAVPCKPSVTDNRSALTTDHSRTVCSTFRPPDTQPGGTVNTLDVVSRKGETSKIDFQKAESDSDDQKPASHSTPPCPPIQSMIGDDNLVGSENVDKDLESKQGVDSMLKKDGMRRSLNVPTPKVPTIDKDKAKPAMDLDAQQSKKGWSITTV